MVCFLRKGMLFLHFIIAGVEAFNHLVGDVEGAGFIYNVAALNRMASYPRVLLYSFMKSLDGIVHGLLCLHACLLGLLWRVAMFF